MTVLLYILLIGGGDWFGIEAERLAARLHAINALAQQGKVAEALEQANQAIVDYPGNSLLYLNRGWLAYHNDDRDSAIKDFERAAQSDDPEIRNRALFNRARALYDKGHKVALDAHLPETAVDLPKEQDVTPMISAAEEASKHLAAAEDAFVDTLVQRPQDRDAKESLEAVTAESQRVKDLLEELKKRQKEQQKDNEQNQKQQDKQSQKQGQQNQDPSSDKDQQKKENQQNGQDQQQNDSPQNQEKKDGRDQQEERDKKGEQKDKDQKPPQQHGDKKEKPGEMKEVPLSPEQVQQLLQQLEELEQQKHDLDKKRAMAVRGKQKVKKDW